MGKVKKAKLKKHISSSQHKKPKANTQTNGTKQKSKIAPRPIQSNQKPTIPFSPTDRILLIGEGDFSFTLSLATHHACTSLAATSFDPQFTLHEKHPQASTHITKILSSSPTNKVIYSVDATKLGLTLPSGGGAAIRKTSWNRIIFNFPHTGGLTKDVNRQVRANQELLVKFFERAMGLLAPRGTIVVTVFEGEPYSLWNVRDLGRHVGLKVERSFKFDPSVYKGYRHARTLGNVEGGGGWKGEERPARTYIFGKEEQEKEEPVVAVGSGANMEALGVRGGGKRKKPKVESEDEDEEDEG